MEIKNIFAISLAASSFSCLAFKAPPNIASTTPDNVNALESKILGSFYTQHGTLSQVAGPGRCDISPVPGCSCPFCTMLRSHIR
ncbi:hypothetical protein AHX05_22950 [Salmonella enterica subsp. indica]|uniref:Uncharacterized protein n=2 Tax=Salmonella enterica TaxID=28901 RepID=A0A702E7A2_SALER|nr:hypothetical protein [Salmonella enterica subsp. indica]EBH9040708.1 hypothetical protein [Salmonella enterica subsp. indica serovar 11:b:e,n,x]EEJ9033721.1 hypothetical protein [Salmonella enterica subsp. enterica serovar Oslo]HAE8104599.1 hypothetical protein [Salmonella enterica subsp. indica serovar 45:a:e,n,x]HAC6567973.1 hypothetical protein [Salmonella enterica subsp. indica]